MGQQMGHQPINGDVDTIEDLFHAASSWGMGNITENRGLEMPILNARAVEFIAKPGKNSDLRKCIGTSVLKFLEKRPGFKGSFVLTPHREPRLVLVFSFWETEMDSRENQWECANEVHRAVAPLVDSFSRVRTYQATFPEVHDTTAESVDLQLC